MRTISAVALASILAIGCDEPRPEPDGGPEVDACATCMPDAGPPDSGPTGDGNDSFATATDIAIDATESGVINPPGDLDYYTFEGTEGQWIAIETQANPDDDPDMVDTVVTLFDSTMTQIAENDDSIPRVSTDTQIITRLPATGTYYILVQEFSTWAGEPDEAMPTFRYDVSITALSTGMPTFLTVDAEAGDDAASAQALTPAASGFAMAVGSLRDAADVDVFSFTIPAGEPRGVTVQLLPGGPDGMGSTATPSTIWVTDEAGTTIIARIDSTQLDEISPSLSEGNYLLFVEHGGTAGANDFYVLKSFRGTGDNPPEANEVTNNAIATPDPVAFAPNPDIADLRSGFVLAHLGDGDVDHFAITVMGTEQVTISCGSLTLGSGVQGLEVVLLDALPGTMMRAMDTETATEGALIENATVPAGDYVVRLTKTGQDAEVTGDWVRCGFHLQPPAP